MHVISRFLLKFKMTAMVELHNFLWAHKLKKLESEMIQILQSYYPLYGDVQVIFLLKFKMATTFMTRYDIGFQASCSFIFYTPSAITFTKITSTNWPVLVNPLIIIVTLQ